MIETSVGADRLFLATFCEALQHETIETDGVEKIRTVLKLHPALAPVKAAILPLVKKDGLPEVAKAIYDDLKFDTECVYEERDTIGKRYTRHDLIGTPFCIAIDYDSLNDQAVTVRHRDTTEQVRMPINEVKAFVLEQTNMKRILKLL